VFGGIEILIWDIIKKENVAMYQFMSFLGSWYALDKVGTCCNVQPQVFVSAKPSTNSNSVI